MVNRGRNPSHPFWCGRVWRSSRRLYESDCPLRWDRVHSSPGNLASTPTSIMKIRLPLFALICAVTTLPVVRAQDAAPKQMPAKEDTTPLGEQMDKISGAFRNFFRKVTATTENED